MTSSHPSRMVEPTMPGAAETVTRHYEPFVAGRGMYGWNYADNAVRHVEEHNCSKGCTVPTPKDIAEFGPGGCCGLLASLFTGDPIPEFEGTDTHVICHARQAPSSTTETTT